MGSPPRGGSRARTAPSLAARATAVALAFFALLAPQAGFGDQSGDQSSPTAIPKDSAKSWRVAVTVFRGDDLSVQNQYLLQSLPLLILDGLAGVDKHRFSREELADYRKGVVEAAIATAELSLAELVDQRSKLLFESATTATASAAPPSTTTPAAAGTSAPASTAPSATTPSTTTPAAAGTPAPATTAPSTTAPAAAGTTGAGAASAPASTPAPGAQASPLATLDASIEQVRERIRFLRSLDPDSVHVEAVKPVELATPSSGGTTKTTGAPAAGSGASGSSAAQGAGGAQASGSPGAKAGAQAAAGGSGATGSSAAQGAGGAPASGSTGGSGASGAAGGGAPAGASSADQLMPYPAVSFESAAREEGVDCIVTGTLSEVEGYLIVEISAYNAALKRVIYSFRKVVTPEDAISAAEETTGPLIAAVLGRSWANLSLTVEPSDSLVYVDRRFYGIGSTEIRLMTAALHTILVRAPGYLDRRATVSLSPSQTRSLTVKLAKSENAQIGITSFPDDADVYVNSQWQGKTPMLLDRPDASAALLIRKAHYNDYDGTLSPTSPPNVEATLQPDVFNPADYADDLRSRFYGSFGAFALSVILPVTFYSLYSDYSVIYQDVLVEPSPNASEYQRLQTLLPVWYYSFLGGTFISAALFANMVMAIVNYLGASH